tara:strand:+ start:2669 stop:3478 length:810 start_codon:yes stop_codon:yes gene_type:complete
MKNLTLLPTYGLLMKILNSAICLGLCLLTASLANADTIKVYYEGVINKVDARPFTPPEKPDGYKLDDTISGTMLIDTDVAASFADILTTYSYLYGPAHTYNIPDTNPLYQGYRIEYYLPNVTVDSAQNFITGTHNPEPSVTNSDNLVIFNGSDRALANGPSTNEHLNNDAMTIQNRDNLYDKEGRQYRSVYQITTTVSFSGEDFLDGMDLNPNFELGVDDFVSNHGVITISSGSMQYYERNPFKGSRIEFYLTKVQVETLTTPQTEICE